MTSRLRPDLITMDVVMPETDGLEATKLIMAGCPTPVLMVTASESLLEVNMSFEALKAGALDLIQKPSISGEKSQVSKEELISKVKTLAQIQIPETDIIVDETAPD